MAARHDRPVRLSILGHQMHLNSWDRHRRVQEFVKDIRFMDAAPTSEGAGYASEENKLE